MMEMSPLQECSCCLARSPLMNRQMSWKGILKVMYHKHYKTLMALFPKSKVLKRLVSSGWQPKWPQPPHKKKLTFLLGFRLFTKITGKTLENPDPGVWHASCGCNISGKCQMFFR